MLIKWSFQHSEFHSNLFLFGVDVDRSSWIIHKLLSKVIYKRHEYTLDEGNFFSQRNCHHFIAFEWHTYYQTQLKIVSTFFPSSRALYHFLVRFFAYFSRLCDILHSNDSIVLLDTRPFLRCIRNKRKFDKSCHRSHRSGATVSFHPFPII